MDDAMVNDPMEKSAAQRTCSARELMKPEQDNDQKLGMSMPMELDISSGDSLLQREGLRSPRIEKAGRLTKREELQIARYDCEFTQEVPFYPGETARLNAHQ
eukprot:1441270-Pyramimonas_sp.AAC.1